MSLHASASRELLDWDPPSASQRALRDAISAESDDARWFGWDALPDGIEPTIVEMLASARARLRV